MNTETIKAIQDAFAPVAEKIGQGAAYGWEVVMQQQIVYAWLGVFWALVGVFGAFGIYLILTKIEWDWVYNPVPILIGIFGGVFSTMAIVKGSITALTHFLNPAYYALEFFIHLTK